MNANTNTDSAELRVIPIDPAKTDSRFRQAICDASNRELDWLWLAGKVSSLPERIYCYRRALYIDPNSVVARQGLELLTNQHHKSSFSLRFLSAILGKTESPVRAG